MPEAEGVNVTLQLPLERVQLEGLKLPEPVATVKLTEPAGVVAPEPAVSDTVAVHVEPWFADTGLVQETAVPVDRRLIVIEAVPELVEWLESPPYWAVIVVLPEPVV